MRGKVCRKEQRAVPEGVQNSVSRAPALQADVFFQAPGEVDRHLRQRQVPVLRRVRPALEGEQRGQV